MQNLTVSIIQSILHWEDAAANLEMFTQKISQIDQPTDLIVLPEMFTSGFTMDPERVAQPMDGTSVQWMQQMARQKDCVIAGSLVIAESGHYYNRLLWVQPDGKISHYDKKHLFSYTGENQKYTPGNQRLIVELKGWKIMPLICYDLRFPVWSRNGFTEEKGFDYDCLLYVANWPDTRSHAWRVMLMARAIENQAYVIGVNRLGEDPNQISYSGDSGIIDPRGENISTIMPFRDAPDTQVLSSCQLRSYRDAFRPWADWDKFSIDI